MIEKLTGEMKNIMFSDINFTDCRRAGIIEKNEGFVQSVSVESVTMKYHQISRRKAGCLVCINEGIVQECSVSDVDAECNFNLGGVVSENEQEGVIKKCLFEDSRLDANCTGGICATNNMGRIITCESSNVELNGAVAGGIVGESISGEVKYSTVVNSEIKNIFF